MSSSGPDYAPERSLRFAGLSVLAASMPRSMRRRMASDFEGRSGWSRRHASIPANWSA